MARRCPRQWRARSHSCSRWLRSWAADSATRTTGSARYVHDHGSAAHRGLTDSPRYQHSSCHPSAGMARGCYVVSDRCPRRRWNRSPDCRALAAVTFDRAQRLKSCFRVCCSSRISPLFAKTHQTPTQTTTTFHCCAPAAAWARCRIAMTCWHRPWTQTV